MQVLNHLHAFGQLLASLLKIVDSLDARVLGGDVLFQAAVAAYLPVYRLVDHLISQPQCRERHAGKRQQ